MKKAILIVLDSVGVGELKDARSYGDEGSHTLDHVYKTCKGLEINELEKLGIGNIEGVTAPKKCDKAIGAFGRCEEASKGKDTVTGHWEISGVILEEPLNTYPEGFSDDIINEFKKRANVEGILGNIVASGTQIIEDLGEEHVKTGYPIIYTSADSVFQIAAHEDIISLEELYKMCEIAREIMMGDNAVARIIARPYVGPKAGQFERTANRRDYSLNPFEPTVLDTIKESNLDVIGVGKIEDIFNGQGITEAIHTKDNMDGVDQTINYIKSENKGLIFTNLVDFDSKFGHRRNSLGYKEALEEFDERIPEIISSMKEDDILIINADHGNDPTYKGTDHTREYIPVLVYGKNIKSGVNLGIRNSFADIGATVADILNVKLPTNGTSFKAKIM